MDDALSGVLAEISARASGPMDLRLLIPPLVAAGMALLAGLRDAREKKPPFFWAMAFDRSLLAVVPNLLLRAAVARVVEWRGEMP